MTRVGIGFLKKRTANAARGGMQLPRDSPSHSTGSSEENKSLSNIKLLDIEDGIRISQKSKNSDFFEEVPEHQRVTLRFKNINAYVLPLGESAHDNRKNALKRIFKGEWRVPAQGAIPETYNQILYHVHGIVEPKEVLALMGPSGSGKTTLLSILGARSTKQMKIKGHVTFNGDKLDKTMKRKIGFVMQDDLLYESLTVFETLYYAAMLRLPKTMSKEKKLERIYDVIKALRLEKCRDTIIGGFFRRGVSGGERKRCSVGHELLVNPSILFLDEPTSGLDSTTAMNLLESLRKLAQGGRSIVTTIHQPSSRLYQQLDKLLLLSDGHVLYYGQAKDSVDYFERLSYSIPPLMNAADFILDLASSQVASEIRDGEESTTWLIRCTEFFLHKSGDNMSGYDAKRDALDIMNIESEILNLGSIDFGEQKSTHVLTDSSTSGKQSFRRLESLFGGPDKGDRWGVDFYSQVAILFKRSLKTRRFESLSTQEFFQFLALGLLSGMFWLQSGQGETLVDARDTVGLLYYMLMFLSFKTMFVSLFTFPEEQRHMIKERASGMYRLSAFYISRVFSDFPSDMSIPSMFIIIVYFMAGLRYSVGAFFGIYGTILLTMFVAQAYGLLLGSWLMNPKTAQAVAAVIMLTFVLTGGYFVLNIPVWIDWVKYLSFIYYSLGLILYLQFDAGNTPLYACYDTVDGATCQSVDVENDPSTNGLCERVTNLQNSLGISQDIVSQSVAIRNGMILLAFLIVLRVAVYFVLRSKTSSM